MAGGMLSDLRNLLKGRVLLASLPCRSGGHGTQRPGPVPSVVGWTHGSNVWWDWGLKPDYHLLSENVLYTCFYPQKAMPFLDGSWVLKGELVSLGIQVIRWSLFSH